MNVAVRPFNVLSLCTGGFGLDLAVELAVPSARVVCGVEWEAFACAYLVACMEAGAVAPFPLWSNLKTFDGRPWRGVVDCLTAGYPCQPFSTAGLRRGSDDPRHLWPDVARVIAEAAPPIVFLENVANHLRLGGREVLSELRGMGYRVAAGLFTASEVGAPHLRKRLFILGVDDSARDGGRGSHRQTGRGRRIRETGRTLAHSQRPDARQREQREQEGYTGISDGHRPSDDGSDVADASRRGQRIAPAADGGQGGFADGCDPCFSCGYRFDHDALGKYGCPNCYGEGLADASGEGSQGRKRRKPHGSLDGQQALGSVAEFRGPLFPPGPADLDRWREVLSADPTLEPAVCSLDDGLARDRRHYLRLAGNGVCPLAAAHAFLSLFCDVTDGGC